MSIVSILQDEICQSNNNLTQSLYITHWCILYLKKIVQKYWFSSQTSCYWSLGTERTVMKLTPKRQFFATLKVLSKKLIKIYSSFSYSFLVGWHIKSFTLAIYELKVIVFFFFAYYCRQSTNYDNGQSSMIMDIFDGQKIGCDRAANLHLSS